MAAALQDVTITPPSTSSGSEGASPGSEGAGSAGDRPSRGLKGVLGVPDGPGPWPAVVVVHEAFGVLPEMRDQVAHLARLGYLALMPDLYTEGGMLRCIGATAKALRSGKGRAWADIEAARTWLSTRDDFNGRVGIIGFCMGGGFALLAATRTDDRDELAYQTASVNYGLLPKDLDAIERSCPVVASYGDKDKTIPDGAAKLEALYTRLGVAHDVKEYHEAGHAFLNERQTGPAVLHPFMRISGIAPNPGAAVDAWERIDRFFGEWLRA